ncbi:MAG: dTDP-4-dehydrorhamnose 3,5-epimerase [Thermodesulfobacteriota bacterium]|nr:dTDP-4-dehydrorhamnose 3,5-epimerase [Thermodesulfobacteriota bacterium]
MTLKCSETSLPGVLLIEPMVFQDDRGFFMETYHMGKYKEAGLDRPFVQDNLSHSRRHTLRGLHYQLRRPQGKLIYVVTGKILDIAVDIRRGSPTFGQWAGIRLSAENRRQLYVPEGFAHGFCVLSDSADVMYKCTDLYAPGDEYGVLWSDLTLAIEWTVENPILSKKDARNPSLQDMPEALLPVYRT